MKKDDFPKILNHHHQAENLQQFLQSPSEYTHLNLNDQKLSMSDIDSLSKHLKTNKILKVLLLNNANIGPVGALTLSECLANNKTLTWLDLESNNIGDLGVIALAASLKNHQTLTGLSLKNNNIGDNGAKELAAAFKNSTVTLYLQGNDKITQELQSSLSTNLQARYIGGELDQREVSASNAPIPNIIGETDSIEDWVMLDNSDDDKS